MDWWGYPSSGICKLFVTVRAVWHDGVCERAGVGIARRQGGMRALRALIRYPRRDGALGVVMDTAGFRTRLMACRSLRFNGLRRFRATGPGWVLGLGMGLLGLAGLQQGGL